MLLFAPHCSQLTERKGVCMTFATQLEEASAKSMLKSIRHSFAPGSAAQAPQEPPGGNHVRVQHFWIEKGELEPDTDARYILTRTISKHLKNLARIVVTRRYPALLQGPTAAGKTSMVAYLAQVCLFCPPNLSHHLTHCQCLQGHGASVRAHQQPRAYRHCGVHGQLCVRRKRSPRVSGRALGGGCAQGVSFVLGALLSLTTCRAGLLDCARRAEFGAL
jgi:hypothetical protein